MIIATEYVNATEGYRFGEDKIDSADSVFGENPEPGEIYRWSVKEYGRCRGKVYIDASGGPKHVGWVFERREKYEDANKTYLREVWVTLRDRDETVREVDYHSI